MTTPSDEIDLRPYLRLLLKHIWLVIIITIILGGAGFALAIIPPDKYQATATLIINRNQFVLSLAENYPTVSLSKDTKTLADAIKTLAHSDVIGQKVIDQKGAQLPSEYRDVAELKKMVSIEDEGEAINIVVTTNDKLLSFLIAQAWAEAARETINRTYTGAQSLDELRGQIEKAQTEYSSAQLALENFYAESNLTYLQRNLSQTSGLLTSLIGDNYHNISYDIQRKQALSHMLAQAIYLRQQIATQPISNAAALGDNLAVLQARNLLFEFKNGIQDSDGNLQFQSSSPLVTFQITDTTPLNSISNEILDDLDAMIETIQNEINQLDKKIVDEATNATQTNQDPRITTVSEYIASLEQQIENTRAIEEQLKTERNLAWESLKTLKEKEKEITLSLTTNAVVSLASEPVLPQKPMPTNTKTYTLAGLVAGFGLGCFIVFLRAWWREELATATE